jgi:mersacidin/lichenicidin family type 2 lantibiotic
VSNLEVVRAWKDPEFRATLAAAVPDHPAGQIAFADPLLDRSTAAKLDPLNLSRSACKTFDCHLTHKCAD